MCDPVTGGAIVVGGLNILGAQKQAAADKAAGEYKAQIFEQNAQVSELSATDATARGQVAESKSRLETGALLGKQRTSYAASGVRIDSGSPVDVLASTAGVGELKAQTIRTDAAREAWGFRAQAQNQRAQAGLARMGAQYAGDAALISGYTRAAAAFSRMS